MAEFQKERWQFDKNIPVAFIAALVMQTCCFVWWASKLDSRVASLEEARIEMKSVTSALPERITRIEVQQQFTNSLLADLLQNIRHKEKGNGESK
jgi:hypothetical protein